MACSITWEGQTLRTLSLDYAAAVGVSTQVANLRCVQGEFPPALAGTLTFGVGPNVVTLPDCALADLRESDSAGGRVWDLSIEDRRWRWREGFPVSADWNQTDRRGKLIPRTVRSPFQVAAYLLLAMGETDFSISLPAGLAAPAGTTAPAPQDSDVVIDPKQEYLNLGQNLPPTGANPRVSWASVPAAKALASFVEQFGCVVILNPINGQVSVEALGQGTPLPIVPGVVSRSPSISPVLAPAAIRVVGAPTRFQARMPFRPVGRDWDDSWQALDNLTYAPAAPAGQRMCALARGAISLGMVVDGKAYTGATGIDDLVGQINADIDQFNVTASALTDSRGEKSLMVRANADGYEFDLRPVGSGVEVVCTAGPRGPLDRWWDGTPGQMVQAQATTRLTYPQARQLAASSVWRTYQLVAADPTGKTSPAGLPLPGVGTTADPLGVGPNPARTSDRSRIVLEPTRVEQIVPRPGDESRTDPATGQPYAAEQYDGYSRDRAAASYGGVYRGFTSGGNWSADGRIVMGNTPRNSQFYVPFDLCDPERQVVRFSTPVYRVLGGERQWPGGDKRPLPDGAALGDAVFLPPRLVIETGFTLLDPATRSPVRFTDALTLNGPAPVVEYPHEDVQQEVYGVYDADHRLLSATSVDADAFTRAVIYLNTHAAQYQLPTALTVTFAGVRLVPLSGQIRQVSWSLSAGGFVTTASQNSEHSSAVLPLPARRRAEKLSPNMLRAFENLAGSPAARGARSAMDFVGPPNPAGGN